MIFIIETYFIYIMKQVEYMYISHISFTKSDVRKSYKEKAKNAVNRRTNKNSK